MIVELRNNLEEDFASPMSDSTILALFFRLHNAYTAMVDTLDGLSAYNLVALLLQSTLYGVYIFTCGTCAGALTRTNGRWRSRKEIQWPLLLAGAFLLMNTSCNVCVQLYRCIELLVMKEHTEPHTGWTSVIKVRLLSKIAIGSR